MLAYGPFRKAMAWNPSQVVAVHMVPKQVNTSSIKDKTTSILSV
jgi:hypothetical protein